jgi:hypothetical protein
MEWNECGVVAGRRKKEEEGRKNDRVVVRNRHPESRSEKNWYYSIWIAVRFTGHNTWDFLNSLAGMTSLNSRIPHMRSQVPHTKTSSLSYFLPTCGFQLHDQSLFT